MNLDELQKAASKGDKGAEKTLFEILSVRFHLFAYHKIWDEEAAKEVAQEALATVAAEYRDLVVHTSFAAWAHRILEFRLMAYLKSKKVAAERKAEAPIDEMAAARTEPDPVLKAALIKCLREVGGRNRKYARILNLHYQGFATSDVCERLSVSLSNCYVLLSRARLLLEACLKRGAAKL